MVIGSLMYAMTSTRPDLAFAVGTLSRFVLNPGPDHEHALRHLLGYIAATTDLALVFPRNTPSTNLEAYSDASFAGEYKEHGKSVTGLLVFFNRSLIVWRSIRQATLLPRPLRPSTTPLALLFTRSLSYEISLARSVT